MNSYGKLTGQMKPWAVMALLVILVLLGSMSFSKPSEARELSFPTAIRRLDCKVFCSKTGFSGYVGGCQCGFTLFSNKRSQPPIRPFMKPSTEKLFYELGTFDESTDSEETPEAAAKTAKSANLYAAIAAKLNGKVASRQSNSNMQETN